MSNADRIRDLAYEIQDLADSLRSDDEGLRATPQETGRKLAEWAAGASPAAPATETAPESDVTEFLELAARVSDEDHDKAVDWLAAEREKNDGLVPAKRLSAASKRLLAKVPA